MAGNVIVDAGFLVSFLGRRDSHHEWAVMQGRINQPTWYSCEAAVSEAFHIMSEQARFGLRALLRRKALILSFDLQNDLEPVLKLLEKYSEVPMSLADACLVRMTEILPDPLILSTDTDFRIYRRHSRQVVPCLLPP